VRFQEILGQLSDLMRREKVEADEDALAMLAEAGDGSMRDALSILDQAIASTNGRITAESVRQLVGSVPSAVLEDLMQAVARGSSEDVLRLADQLVSSGQNPAYFAKQLVRFLRNTLVAKIAGRDSHLLQISSDERARAAGIAGLFSEEDLARHLQIMLRTHGELGYKQEQRFHLELGLLKMAHAARLLPIEQLLSEAENAGPGLRDKPLPRPTAVGESRSATAPAAARSNTVSPFAADSARKSGPKSELSLAPSPLESPRSSTPGPASAMIILGSAVPVAEPEPAIQSKTQDVAQTLLTQPQPDVQAETRSQGAPQLDEVRAAVLNALADANQRMVVTMLETGEWKVEGSEILVKVAASASLIEMSVGADAKRVAMASASGILGRPAKFKVLPGGAATTPAPRTAPNGGGRNRAEQDPVVRRMQQKFGAEIRTIIDQKEKR
jgi:DNA polymerase III subunit gamma/tau